MTKDEARRRLREARPVAMSYMNPEEQIIWALGALGFLDDGAVQPQNANREFVDLARLLCREPVAMAIEALLTSQSFMVVRK
jgi:hypothetical protein